MKYLKYFESYRQGVGQLPLQEIDREEFKNLLKKNCTNFLNAVKEIDFENFHKYYGPPKFLYRKFMKNHGNFVLTNPKISEHRRIAPWSTSGNWHNLIISNLHSWRHYPRRNKSMIVSGWSRASTHRGNDMYLVIPFDTTKIGVCRGSEFWEAFNVWKDKKVYISDWAKKMMDTLSNQTGKEFQNDDSWEDILPYLDRKYDTDFFEGYDRNKTLLQNLNNFLDPVKNEFKLETSREVYKLQEKNCLECWFEDEALLVNWKYLSSLTTEEIKELFPLSDENWIGNLKNMLK